MKINFFKKAIDWLTKSMSNDLPPSLPEGRKQVLSPVANVTPGDRVFYVFRAPGAVLIDTVYVRAGESSWQYLEKYESENHMYAQTWYGGQGRGPVPYHFRVRAATPTELVLFFGAKNSP